MTTSSKVVPIVPREVQHLIRVIEKSRDQAARECAEVINLIVSNRPPRKGEPKDDLLLDRLVHLIWDAHRRGFLDALDFESDRWARGLCGNNYKQKFRQAGVRI